MRVCLAALFVLACGPAWAQQLEVTPLIGYRTTADIPRKATGIDELGIDGGATWGLQATYFFTSNFGIEALGTYQPTAVSMSTASEDAKVFSMMAGVIQGNVVYRFRTDTASVRPFVFGGAGPALLSARSVGDEVKFAWTAGAGLSWFLLPRIGLKVLAHYAPTVVRGDAPGRCDPFGFCQNTLTSFGMAIGTAFRF